MSRNGSPPGARSPALKAVAFDFDGVLVDSVDIKTNAFAELFSWAGDDVVQRVVAHHLANSGVSRYEKIGLYFREFAGRTLTPQELEIQCSRFSQMVFQAVVAAAWIPGALDALEYCAGQLWKLFVVSATPEREVQEIVRLRGIASRFESVLGAPAPKAQLLQSILARHDLTAEQLLFVGDAAADREAAVEAGVPFLGVRNQAVDWQRLGVMSIGDLTEFQAALGSLDPIPT